MPAPRDVCNFDNGQWRDRIEDKIWRSDDSLDKRLTVLEVRSDQQRRFQNLWMPIIFSIGTSGLFLLLQVLWDRFLKGG